MKDHFRILLRWLPLILIVLAFIAVWYSGLTTYLSFASLKEHRSLLEHWVKENYFLTVIVYISIYVISVILSIPGATIITLAGGLLFGPLGVIYVVLAATLGATGVFFAVKNSLGNFLENKVSGWMSKLEKGFRENAFNYLMVLRLIPLVPFWAINIAAGLLNVKPKTFISATFLGIIPGSFIYVMLGNSLNVILTSTEPDLKIIFKPVILIPLIGLAILSLLPIVYKKYKGRSHGRNSKC